MSRQKGKSARPEAMPAYSKDEMKRLLEAVLFATDKPVAASTLAQVLSGSKEESVREALSELSREYEETGRSFILKEVGGGFLLLTHPAYEPWVRKLFRGRLTLRLSKSALETIAIVAYRQPISKAEIETIRGVNADGVLNTLLERKLIRVVGRKPGMGRALLYGTTGDFLTYMGLNNLEELPQMEEMKAILESREPSSAASREAADAAVSPETARAASREAADAAVSPETARTASREAADAAVSPETARAASREAADAAVSPETARAASREAADEGSASQSAESAGPSENATESSVAAESAESATSEESPVPPDSNGGAGKAAQSGDHAAQEPEETPPAESKEA